MNQLIRHKGPIRPGYEISIKGFTLPTGRKVFMTNRYDCCEPELVEQFVKENDVGIRFMFTDDYLEPWPNVEWHWYPWIPTNDLPFEGFWAFLQTCSRWDLNPSNSIAKSMWFHCDSSTMRAPTFLGLYLRAVYGDDAAKDIIPIPEQASHFEDCFMGNPLNYSMNELDGNKRLKQLVEAWQKGGEIEAYEIFMGREDILSALNDEN